ncbi:peptidoglycan-associated lipoprotein Pal [Candidatus Sumerlaeota bacterium]|nr:peptidoglycan-associated lipoprotein Pal [Candidatus Sumerlaeota bacterium]
MITMTKSGYWVRLILLLTLVSFVATGCAGCRKLFGGKDKSELGLGIDTTDEGGMTGDVAPQRPPGEEADPTSELVTVHFDYDSSELTPKAREALMGNLEWLQQHADAKILIEGHCDERGTIEYNLALGERRANSVKSFLQNHGIDASRLFTISYGEERPIDLGYGESSWWKNRRAEFKKYD